MEAQMSNIGFLILLFLIGFIGSFISGMVGVGGSIIKYPMLLYIPPLLGFVAFTAHEVSGISAIQVFFATISGVFAYRKGGYLNKKLIIAMGVSILIGSLIGGFGSKSLAEDQINIVYAILATIAAIMMFVPKKVQEDTPLQQLNINYTLAGIFAFIVGLASGIVGAAGAFLLVPIMLVILRIPTKITIATSLAVTFISSIGATAGKIATGQVMLVPSIVMVIASIIAAPLGAQLGKKMNPKVLQMILAVLIVATSIKIWLDIF